MKLAKRLDLHRTIDRPVSRFSEQLKRQTEVANSNGSETREKGMGRDVHLGYMLRLLPPQELNELQQHEVVEVTRQSMQKMMVMQ